MSLTNFSCVSRSTLYDENHSMISYANLPKEIIDVFGAVGYFMNKFEERDLNGKKDYNSLRDCYVNSNLFNIVEEIQKYQKQTKCDISILPLVVIGLVESLDGSLQGEVTKSVTQFADAFKLLAEQEDSISRSDTMRFQKYSIIGENTYAFELNHFYIECLSTRSYGLFESIYTHYVVDYKKALFYLNMDIVERKIKEEFENDISDLNFDLN